MPKYDFKCDGCGTIVEKQFSMLNVPSSVRCENCKNESNPLRGWAFRVFHAPILNLNRWKPDPMEMDGEKEAIAAGMNE